MVQKLQIRFIVLTMAVLLVFQVAIVTGMNVINYKTVIQEADEILEILSRNKGIFPEEGLPEAWMRRPAFSPEIPYETRFFSVFFDEEGNVINTDMSRIAAVSDEEAMEFAMKVKVKQKQKGFIDDYRYIEYEEPNGSRAIFMDCGRRVYALRKFLFISIGMSLVGFAALLFVVMHASGKILRPIAESYDKQKRFITDAGHEIKTPLTIIKANADMLEMEIGENECISDILQQTKRLRSLTEDLVLLSRMEEAGKNLQTIEFPMSEVVEDAANAFSVLAQQQNKQIECRIQPLLTLNGNDKAIEQFVSILVDNALKYSPENSRILLELEKKKRAIHLSVSNHTNAELSQLKTEHIFDRFYRPDYARNSSAGGHGIGLSVAKAIVESHGGTICASVLEGNIFQIKAAFPV